MLAIIGATHAQAQSYMEEVIEISAGYGWSLPYDEQGYHGSGLYAQGEYLFGVNEYIDLRAYVGYILTKMDGALSGSFDQEDKATSNAVLFGGKARFRIPVEWVAPFAEIGLGGSIGSFETITVNTKVDENGIYAHIPFSIGVELGPRHNMNVRLTSFFHSGVQQFTVAAAIGIRIPIGYY